ncbi:MAG: hypothetical protein J7527_01525 [Chitinophagaceae bacterium]|nr:hypothetical protein [Chitinophagaceae bacterium]
MAVSFKPIKPLLQTGTNSASRWFSYAGLGIGVLLLLCSIQMFINIQRLLKEGSIRRDGFDYISITKSVTNETMGTPDKNQFSEQDLAELRAQPFINGVSPLLPNDFRVTLGAGSVLAFNTDMFLETLDDEFIDTLPPTFKWQEGQTNIPLILSSDFFEIYNVFAPGQGLPQISRETAMGIPVQITCEGNGSAEVFIGKIVAFSDRVNSVLVPKNFLIWSNKKFGKGQEVKASRIFVKTKDANSTDLLKFVDSKKYSLNKDKTLLGRNKMVIQGIFSGLGIFGLLVVLLALMLFSFYLQLVIARSKDSLQLLITLGYSPKWLSSNVAKLFIPIYIAVVLAAMAATQLMQWSFHHFVMYDRPELSPFVDWTVMMTGIILVFLSVFANYRLVRRLFSKLG